MSKITEKDLQGILWENISIQETKDGEKIIILICKNQQQADALSKMINENPFSMNVNIKADTKHYVINLLFSNSEYGISCDTAKTEENYPAIKWIKQNLITHLTTGFWGEVNADGFRATFNNPNLKALTNININ